MFVQVPIFSELRFLNEFKTPQNHGLNSLPEEFCYGPEGIHRSKLGLNPRTLGLEASTFAVGVNTRHT